MNERLDRLSWRWLIPLAVAAALAPWPIGEVSHLLQKLGWLAEGRLSRPLDIVDLVFHASPTLLSAAKMALGSDRSREVQSDESTS